MQLLLPGEDTKFSDPADVGGSYEAFQYRALLACCSAMGGDLRQANYSSLREGSRERAPAGDVDRSSRDRPAVRASNRPGCGPRGRAQGHAARAVQPAADLHAAAGADQGQAHLMTAFQSAVDATFGAFGIDAVYTPAGGEPVSVRVRRFDAGPLDLFNKIEGGSRPPRTWRSRRSGRRPWSRDRSRCNPGFPTARTVPSWRLDRVVHTLQLRSESTTVSARRTWPARNSAH